jgi:hypothetical protein
MLSNAFHGQYCTPAPFGNQEEQHSQPIRKKEKVKTDWSESFGKGKWHHYPVFS